MTSEEFDATPEADWDDRYRYELIRGVLVVTPIAGIGERDPNDYLGYLLTSYQEHHPQGRALDLTVPEQTVAATVERRRADRVIWAGSGRLPDPEVAVPTIVIEFVSKSRRDFVRDYQEKRAEYLAAGVREYWIIDRFRRIMTVHRRSPEGDAEQVVREGETYQTELLPGFLLPLARILSRADQWNKARRTPPAGGTDG